MHRRDLGIQGAGRENDLDRRALLRVLSPPQYLSIGRADDGVASLQCPLRPEVGNAVAESVEPVTGHPQALADRPYESL